MEVAMFSFSANGESAASLVCAKNIDYTPDVTSDQYWDTHHICVMRVTDIGKDSAGKELLTFAVTKQISEGPMEQAETVASSHLWFASPRMTISWFIMQKRDLPRL
jgi:hypothetical protein